MKKLVMLADLTYSVKDRLIDLKWWFLHRFHPSYRYHTHKYHHLKPGWHDVDVKMLHAAFDLFVEFVEKEKGLEQLEYQAKYWSEVKEAEIGSSQASIDEIARKEKEVSETAAELYIWWKEHALGDVEVGHDEDAYDKENEMLKKLIDIRIYLWT